MIRNRMLNFVRNEDKCSKSLFEHKISFIKSSFFLYSCIFAALIFAECSISSKLFLTFAIICSVPTLIQLRSQRILSPVFILLLIFFGCILIYKSVTKTQLDSVTTVGFFGLLTLNWLTPCIDHISYKGVKLTMAHRCLVPTLSGMGFLFLALICNRAGLDWFSTHGEYSRFPYTWEIWESKPIREHLFLTYDSRWAKFEDRTAYHGYSIFYLFLHYLPLKMISVYKGMTFTELIRLSPFVTLSLVICFLPPFLLKLFNLNTAAPDGSPDGYRQTHLNRFQRSTTSLSFLVGIFFTLLTIPDLLSGPLIGDADNSFPMSAFFQFFFVVSFYFSSNHRQSLALGAAYSMICPIPAAIFFVGASFFALVSNRTQLFKLSGLNLLVAILCYKLPKIVANSANITIGGSSLLSRSGLDGDKIYFDNIFSSIFTPTHQIFVRELSFFWPAIFLTAISFCICLSGWCPKKHRSAIFLVTAGWMFESILFPQSRNIHPYLYDISTSVGGAGCFAIALSAIAHAKGSLAKLLLPWILLALFSCTYNNAIMITRIFRNF